MTIFFKKKKSSYEYFTISTGKAPAQVQEMVLYIYDLKLRASAQGEFHWCPLEGYFMSQHKKWMYATSLA